MFVTSSPTSRESQLIHTPEFRLHTGEQDIAAAVKPPRSFLSQPIRRCPHQIRLLFLFLSLENSLNTFIFFHKYLFLLLLFKLQQPPPPFFFYINVVDLYLLAELLSEWNNMVFRSKHFSGLAFSFAVFWAEARLPSQHEQHQGRPTASTLIHF